MDRQEPGGAWPPLFEVDSPFFADHGRLRLLDDLGASPKEIRERLLDGSYRKPFIVENGPLRYLHFGLTYVQSVMRIGEPDALDLRYTQKMMGFLLFQPQPSHLLMLGLGGGSLVKFCHRQLSETAITVVEIDPDVIALRKHFLVPEDDARLRVIQDDGAAYVRRQREQYDALLVDAFDESGMAPSVADVSFLRAAYAALRPEGVLVMNLAGEKRRYTEIFDDVLDVFEHQVLLLSVPDDGNHVLFAFKTSSFEPNWRRLRVQAKELKARHELDFPAFVQKMERAARLGIDACFPLRGDY